MRSYNFKYFYERVHNQREFFPLDCQFELTYGCNLNCIHCYCKGLEDREGELSFGEVKKILAALKQAGCLWLAFTGGEPLMREDFWKIYLYAKKKGFIISIFTNAQLFTLKIIDYLTKAPPHSIEITLNGITKDTYEKITQTKGSFHKAVENIRILARHKIPLVLKANLLKQNKDEITKIKKWTEEILGRPKKGYYFKYDPLIYPRLNGDKTPCNYRLSPEEILGVLKQDKDMWQEYLKQLYRDFPVSGRNRNYLYQCNSWRSQVFINPQGRLKFCLFSEKFSFDLKGVSFKEGFLKMCSKISKQSFKADSLCQYCRLRAICVWCPAKAYLESGSEEEPVEYYCHFTEELWHEKR